MQSIYPTTNLLETFRRRLDRFLSLIHLASRLADPGYYTLNTDAAKKTATTTKKKKSDKILSKDTTTPSTRTTDTARADVYHRSRF